MLVLAPVRDHVVAELDHDDPWYVFVPVNVYSAAPSGAPGRTRSCARPSTSAAGPPRRRTRRAAPGPRSAARPVAPCTWRRPRSTRGPCPCRPRIQASAIVASIARKAASIARHCSGPRPERPRTFAGCHLRATPPRYEGASGLPRDTGGRRVRAGGPPIPTERAVGAPRAPTAHLERETLARAGESPHPGSTSGRPGSPSSPTPRRARPSPRPRPPRRRRSRPGSRTPPRRAWSRRSDTASRPRRRPTRTRDRRRATWDRRRPDRAVHFIRRAADPRQEPDPPIQEPDGLAVAAIRSFVPETSIGSAAGRRVPGSSRVSSSVIES